MSRVLLALLLCGGLALAPTGCSRSSGSSGGTNPGAPTPTPGGPGSPTPVPTQRIVVDTQGTNLADLIRSFPGGVQLIVSPGTYPPLALTRDDISGPLTLQADETGEVTGRRGAITILAQDRDAAINLNGLDDVVIDGFTLIGGRRAGMLIANGTQIVLQNNVVRGSGGDGMRIERSSAVLVFNNLIYQNAGIGLSARGLNTMEAVNNTVHGNAGGGIAFLRLAFDGGSAGSPFGFLLNNIIDGNTNYGIRVDNDSQFGFEGNYNLNTDGYIGVGPGPRDLQLDPMFLFPSGGDFRLQTTLGVGGSPAIDRGDPNTEAFFVASLTQRTTREDSYRDVPPVDMGYHYPGGIDTPTPPPSFTPRDGVGAPPPSTPTPTPTATLAAAAAGQSAANSAAAGVAADGSSVVALPTATATATATPEPAGE